jgi:hypothetical protein
MHPVMPPELMHSAAQMVVYFATVVAGVVGFLMTTRF